MFNRQLMELQNDLINLNSDMTFSNLERIKKLEKEMQEIDEKLDLLLKHLNLEIFEGKEIRKIK